jgi:hypothetical protein
MMLDQGTEAQLQVLDQAAGPEAPAPTRETASATTWPRASSGRRQDRAHDTLAVLVKCSIYVQIDEAEL